MTGRSCLAFVLLALAALGGCSANKAYMLGPNYSSTPCVDNCGTDTTCQARCTDLNHQTGGNGVPLMVGK